MKARMYGGGVNRTRSKATLGRCSQAQLLITAYTAQFSNRRLRPVKPPIFEGSMYQLRPYKHFLK